jgi:hypothetical protein
MAHDPVPDRADGDWGALHRQRYLKQRCFPAVALVPAALLQADRFLWFRQVSAAGTLVIGLLLVEHRSAHSGPVHRLDPWLGGAPLDRPWALSHAAFRAGKTGLHLCPSPLPEPARGRTGRAPHLPQGARPDCSAISSDSPRTQSRLSLALVASRSRDDLSTF